MFALGYLGAWTGFSVAATALQFGLEQAALLSQEMMAATSPAFGAGLLIAAGLYQWSPLKLAFLRGCRSPLELAMTARPAGRRGDFVLGLRNSAYCVGRCSALMLLLFVGGVMNLAWIGGIALFVLVEKLCPAGPAVSRAAGLALVAWGAAILSA